jgi:DNA transposition AAA+ family ATPase
VPGLELVRDIFDHGGIGLVLIGMPGIEKRLARYPQFYSRIGFVHEFRPLGASEMRRLFAQSSAEGMGSGNSGRGHPYNGRITGGNFRLLERLLTQIERVLEINGLKEVSRAVVEAARESLVIGQS